MKQFKCVINNELDHLKYNLQKKLDRFYAVKVGFGSEIWYRSDLIRIQIWDPVPQH